jgi:hypothetical protein
MINTRQLEAAITSTFIWSFKKGDNIIYNFEILDKLYDYKRIGDTRSKRLLNKPITLIIISIVECVLEDFTRRCKHRSTDPLPNITQSQILEYKTKKYDKFEHFSSISHKHNLFDQEPRFYTMLDYLRKIRNRFHIQNCNNDLEPDEYSVFTDIRLHASEAVLEIIIEKMMTKFPRRTSSINFSDIVFPWDNL